MKQADKVPPPRDRFSGVPESTLNHPVLGRLIREVRNEERTPVAYDRIHNRHNRSI